MKEIVECIPNFSTSDSKVVEAILNEIEKVEEAYLLDHTYDNYYNRLVVSYEGPQRVQDGKIQVLPSCYQFSIKKLNVDIFGLLSNLAEEVVNIVYFNVFEASYGDVFIEVLQLFDQIWPSETSRINRSTSLRSIP